MLLEGFRKITLATGVPSMSITKNGITFNKAAVIKMDKAPSIFLFLNSAEKKIAIQKCAPEADGAVPFYKETSGYIAAKINNGDFIHTVSKMMNWQLDKAGYKCLGDAYPEEGIMIFDLSSAVEI